MATGDFPIIKQRPVVCAHVFQCNPGRDQVAEGVSGHMNAVGMRTLIASLQKIDGLKRHHGFIKNEPQQFQQSFVIGDVLYQRRNAIGKHEFIAIGEMKFSIRQKTLNFVVNRFGLFIAEVMRQFDKAVI